MVFLRHEISIILEIRLSLQEIHMCQYVQRENFIFANMPEIFCYALCILRDKSQAITDVFIKTTDYYDDDDNRFSSGWFCFCCHFPSFKTRVEKNWKQILYFGELFIDWKIDFHFPYVQPKREVNISSIIQSDVSNDIRWMWTSSVNIRRCMLRQKKTKK